MAVNESCEVTPSIEVTHNRTAARSVNQPAFLPDLISLRETADATSPNMSTNKAASSPDDPRVMAAVRLLDNAPSGYACYQLPMVTDSELLKKLCVDPSKR